MMFNTCKGADRVDAGHKCNILPERGYRRTFYTKILFISNLYQSKFVEQFQTSIILN